MDVSNAIKVAGNAERLAILKELELLDTPAEEAFDKLTRLASKVTNSPIALVSLIDMDRQFLKSQIGLEEPFASKRETPLSHSFCMHVVADNSPLIVEDAREHPVLKDNLAIPDLGVIAYLGMPLTTTKGIGLGSFCVIDTAPRKWANRDIEILRELASTVMMEIELRVQIKARRQAETALKKYANTLEMQVTARTQELQQVYEQLQEIDQLKSKFIDDISHELRTPVTNLNIYLDLLGSSKPEKREKYEAVLREQSGRLTSLLGGILDFANLQKSLEQIDLDFLDLNALVARVVASFEHLAQERKLNLTFNLAPGIAQVWGNASQLEQVVFQLLQNAITYTFSGQVQLRMDQVSQENLVRLTIEDTGIGMDEEELAHCFERFYRGKHVGQLNIATGAGLGLAQVKDIVAFHKGWVEVESKIDQGSIFSVYLPAINSPDLGENDKVTAVSKT